MLAAACALTAVVRPVDLSAEGVFVSALVFACVLVLANGTRGRREKAAADVHAAEQAAEPARERATVALERAAGAATAERLRITRELHDVIGHAMSVMVVQAAVAERFLDTDPRRTRTAVHEIARTGRRSLAEMRHLLDTMRDGEPPGPTPTLDDVTALVARIDDAGLPVQVTVMGERPDVPPGVDLAAYHVVQEALTNCLRHACASRATVTVTYHRAGLETEIVDDGPRSVTLGPTGHGLAGMRERVAIYGGDLFLGAADGAGFRVHARFPFEPPVPVPVATA